jgi:hypothetical protein
MTGRQLHAHRHGARCQPAVGRAISTEVQAPVDSLDLTQTPPLPSVNGQNYSLDKIKRIVRSGA